MAVRRRKQNKDHLLRRAHLGDIDNAEELLNLARQNGIATAPLDVEALMKVLGIVVKFSGDLPKETSGMLVNEDGRWICTVNAKHHKTRQRFTMAHELAHFILHRNEKSSFTDYTYFRNEDGNDSMEYEANAFAGALLMPEAGFSFYINNISSSLDDVAKYFGVSPLAVQVRATQLGFNKRD